MLNTAADYEYNAANIESAGVVIEGRIMPTEDINSQGHPVRRENLAYLCEAVSERWGYAYWNVPARNANLTLAIPQAIWAQIKLLYTYNTPSSGSYWVRRYVKPSYSFGDADSGYDDTAAMAYSDALLSDADIPAYAMHWDSAPYYLYADDIRTMFYYINQLQRRWMPLTTPSGGVLRLVYGKYGGAVYYDAVVYDNNASDPSVQISVHDSATISGFTNEDVIVSGSVTGGSGDDISYGDRLNSVELYAYSSAYLSSNTLYIDGWETYYVGDVQFHYDGAAQKCGADNPPLLFVKFHIYGSTSGGTQVTKYLWRPIANATFVRDANGDVTDIRFPVTRAYLRALVQTAYPSASFSYSTVGSGVYDRYFVDLSDWTVLEYPDFASLLPSAWTWTP